jgi:succinate dehydrogenase hydrophobic anchor subunit
MVWKIIIVIFNILMWMIVYHTNQGLKQLEVTDETKPKFLEPMINILAVLGIISLWIINEI